MTEQLLRRFLLLSAVLLLLGGLLALALSAQVAAGLLAGGLWNVANLWCLSQLLEAWLGPRRSTKRVVAWLLVKFPLLYVLAVALLQSTRVSMVGFGIGFTLVLVAAGLLLVREAQRFGRREVA